MLMVQSTSFSTLSTMISTSKVKQKQTFAFHCVTPLVLYFTAKKLQRGISKATDNVAIVLKARKQLAQQFEKEEADDQAFEIPKYTFLLPDFTVYPADFHNFLEKELIEQSAMSSLQAAGKLNWWVNELGITSK